MRNIIPIVIIFLGLSCSNGITQVPKNYQFLINTDKELDTVDLFSFRTRLDLENSITTELKINDFCNRQIYKTFEFEYLGTKLYPDILVYKSCPEKLEYHGHPRIDDLELFIHSNDSIRYSWNKIGTIDSISNWVYEYYKNESETFKCYSPYFSRFVIVCDDNYSFLNLQRVINEGIKGYLKAIENISLTYYNCSFVAQSKTTADDFKQSIPFQIALAIRDRRETPPPPPPPPPSDSLIASLDELLGYNEKIDTIHLPQESFINSIPYTDTLTVNFSTSWNHDGEYVPHKIWKENDTIHYERPWSHMPLAKKYVDNLLNGQKKIFGIPAEYPYSFFSDEIETILNNPCLSLKYHVGGKFSMDDRTNVWFYQRDRYVLRNDTLYTNLEKNKLPNDSITKLVVCHRISNSDTSKYLDILKENTYYTYGVLFYKGIGCNKPNRLKVYYQHKVEVDGYWETDFGTFFKIILYDKTDFSSGNCSHRTEYFISDKFEFYGIDSENKRIEAFKLEQMEPDMKKYKLKYCE